MPKIVPQRQFQISFANEMRSRLHQAGEHLVNELKERLDRPWPPSSVPGEYPARRTGVLQESVRYELDEIDLRIDLIAGAPYAQDLVEMKRKMSSDVLEEEQEAVALILTGKI